MPPLPDQFWVDMGPVLRFIVVLAAITVPVVGGVIVVYLRVIGGRVTQVATSAAEATKAAERAATLSEPTGNGFAAAVNEKLDTVVADMSAATTEIRAIRKDIRGAKVAHHDDITELRGDIANLDAGHRRHSKRLGLLERLTPQRGDPPHDT